jgi:hypothetical protein
MGDIVFVRAIIALAIPAVILYGLTLFFSAANL